MTLLTIAAAVEEQTTIAYSGVYKNFVEQLPLDRAHILNALLIALIGILVVFVILGIIAGFVKLLGGVFDKLGSKKTAPKKATDIPSVPAGNADAKAAPQPVKAEVKLIDVTEEEAAMIMAIVSNQTKIPLNHLKFNTIKPVEENK